MSNPTTLEKLRQEVTRPAFNPTATPVQVDSDTLHIRGGPWNGPILSLRSSNEQGIVGRLVDRIDGETHIDEILESFDGEKRAEVARVIYRLKETGAIFDRATLEDVPLYNHHAMKTTFGEADTVDLDSKTVLLVNAGRIGPYVAEHLLDIGVGEVRFKEPVDGAAGPTDDLSEIDRFRVDKRSDLGDSVERSDFVVYTADRPVVQLERRINETTYEHETPWVIGQIQGYDGHIGPAIFPGETACLECFRTRVSANSTDPDGLREYRQADHASEKGSPGMAILPPFAHAVASMLSLDLVHLLSYGTGYTAGRAIWMNSVDFGFDADSVLKLPRCDVCGVKPASRETPFISLDDVASLAGIDSEKHEELDHGDH